MVDREYQRLETVGVAYGIVQILKRCQAANGVRYRQELIKALALGSRTGSDDAQELFGPAQFLDYHFPVAIRHWPGVSEVT
jgi:hypothetical protein